MRAGEITRLCGDLKSQMRELTLLDALRLLRLPLPVSEYSEVTTDYRLTITDYRLLDLTVPVLGGEGELREIAARQVALNDDVSPR